MPHVFLSYSRIDQDFAEVLEADLEDAGHPIWRDKSDIEGGAGWAEAIERALADSYALVVVLSAAAVDSAWVSREILTAESSETPIIPVLIGDCVIPEAIAETQVVDFSGLHDTVGYETIGEYRQALRRLVSAVDSSRPVLAFIRQLESDDESTREGAAVRLGDLGDHIAITPLVKALTDEDADVRFESVRALGQLTSDVADNALLKCLNDKDPDVIAAAVHALGRSGSVEAIGPILALLEADDRFVRSAATQALGRFKAMIATRQLVHMMRNDPISDVRNEATIALCRIGGREAERALRRADVDSDRLLAQSHSTDSGEISQR